MMPVVNLSINESFGFPQALLICDLTTTTFINLMIVSRNQRLALGALNYTAPARGSTP